MKNGLLFLICLCSLPLLASKRDSTQLPDKEVELQSLCKQLFHTKKINEQQKAELNNALLSTFESVLLEPGSFETYSFDSLRNDIGILMSPDEHFRIINWNVPNADGTYSYYGFIQSKYNVNAKGKLVVSDKNLQLFPLIDKSAEIKNPENVVTDNKRWYGMLYNKIIVKKTKKKTYYTLLGWDGNDKFTQKKIIDVLTFDNKGNPHFGADIFNMPRKYPKRVIFEYSASCSISLRYNSKKDTIIFDHLAPTQPQLEGQFQYYCSDMSYDGFGFKKGKWNYGMDVKAMNEKDEKDRFYHDPHDRSIGHDQSNTIIERKKGKGKKQK